MKKLFFYFSFLVLTISVAQEEGDKILWRPKYDSLIKFYHARDLDRFNFYFNDLYKNKTYKIHDSLRVSVGAIYASLKKNEQEALKYLNKSEEKLLVATKNKNLLGWNYFYKAKWYFNNSFDKKALENFYKADSVFSSINRKSFLSTMTKVGICDVLMKSVVNDHSLITKQVLPHIEEGIKLSEDLNFDVPKSIFVYKKGELFFNEGDLEKSEYYFKSALAISEKINNNTRQSLIYNYLSKISVQKNKIDTALVYQKKAVEKTKDLKDYGVVYSAHLRLGILYNTIQDFNKAIAQFNYAKTQFTKSSIRRKEDLYYIEFNLAEAYYGKKEYQKGYLSLKSAHQNAQESQKIKNIEQVEEIEAKYQNEKKEEKILLLTSQNNLAEEQKTNQRNLFIAAITITGLTALFFFFQYRNRQKTTKKLQELDTAKSTFFANISHEFRTPITLIKGPIEDQLETETLAKKDRKNLLIAQKNTSILESLVDQLLMLSKLESGYLKLQVQQGDLTQFLKNQAAAFIYVISEKHITYTASFPENNSEDEWFDVDAFQKITTNLLSNAIKYTPEKGIITFSGQRKNDSYQIRVFNTGSYINTVQQKHLFERFYQTSEQNSGSGIGLALTKELVELHKGKITVASEENTGTTFTVTIPVTKASYQETEFISETLKNYKDESDFNDTVNTTTILTETDAPILLIVEDTVDVATYLTSVFEGSFEIHTAFDGEEGYKKAVAIIPDVIISDIMMPKMDGYDFTAKLKSNPLTSHIPITLLTAKVEEQDKLKGIEKGADAYVLKPFNSKILKATLNNLLENRRKLQDRFASEVILRPQEISVTSADEQFLKNLQEVLDKHLTDPTFTATEFCTAMAVSRMQLHRKLKALTAQSTTEFLRSQRLKTAAILLKENKISISEVGYAVGFNDASYFTKCFKQEYGCAPSQFTNSGKKPR